MTVKFGKVIAGSGSKKSKAGKEAPDNLESNAYVSILDLIGEGQIGGLVGASNDDKEKSIRLNQVKMREDGGALNFEDVSWAERTGEQDQDIIDGFDNIETPFSVGTEMRSGSPVTFTVTNPEASKVRIIINVAALLESKDGNTNGSEVSFDIHGSINGGAYSFIESKKIVGKTTSRYQEAYVVQLPSTTETGAKALRWSFRLTKTTPDSTSAAKQNTIALESYSEIVALKLNYPNSALMGTRFSAEKFSSMPKREYLVDGLLVRVPSNYDPVAKTYSGIWDGTFKIAVSSNPAWVLYDLLLSKRYGLGERITPAMVDETKLYQIGQYCDQLVDDGFGNKEPRYSINCAIYSRTEAYELITNICSMFNGMAYWNGANVGFMMDSPSDPVMAFNTANIEGSFNYSGSSAKDRHSVVAVTYNDPEQDYKQEIEYVEDPELIQRYGVRKLDIQAFGCTSRGQAHRMGRWMLYTEHYQSEIINFTAGLDTGLLLPGDLILIQDEFRSGERFGGRLIAHTTTSAHLDSVADLTNFPGSKIALMLADGSFVERRISAYKNVSVPFGETDNVREVTKVEWTQPLEVEPVKQAIWVISSPSLEPVTARVVNIAQGDKVDQVKITAIPHLASKYEKIENDVMLELPILSTIKPYSQVAPSEVRIAQEVYVEQGISKVRLNIDWSRADRASNYHVEWKRDNQPWQKLAPTVNLFSQVDDVFAGTYTARVRAENIYGAFSKFTNSVSADLLGKNKAIANAVAFNVQGVLFGYELDWGYPANSLDYSHVVIEQSVDPATVTPTSFNLSFPTSSHSITGLQGNLTTSFRIKAVDRSGNESPFSAWVVARTDANPEKVLEILQGNIGQNLFDTALTEKIDKSARDSAKALTDVAKEVTDRTQAVANEASARATAISAEATARTNAIQAETTARTTALAKEATDRANAISTAVSKEATDRATALAKEATDRANAISTAVSKEASDRAAALAKEATDRANAITAEVTARNNAITAKATEITTAVNAQVKTVQDGLTKEVTDRTAGDTAVRGELNAYKTSNNTAVATVLQKVETVTTAHSATATKVSALESSFGNIESGLNTSNANIEALSQTVANNQSATALQISELETEFESTNTATSGRITTVEESVSTLEGTVNTKVTELNASIATTNSNVSTAQTAAQNAMNAANAKGKVFYSTTAPATAERLSQNLWIDTTGGANTPKRWSGSAWVAVTDKVATDALAAANAATTLANTKADSSAVTNLSNRVDQTETSISAQGQNITTLQNSLSTTNTNVGTAQAAAQSAMDAANAKGKVIYGSTAPVAADRLSQNLWIDTTNNTNTPKRWNGSAWVAVTDKVATDALAAANAASTLASTKADSTAVSALTNRVTTAEGTITSQGQNITSLQNSVSTINTNLATKADGSAVTDLSNRVTATEGSISTQGQSITSLQGSLATTNTNVGNAQSAAQGALDAANAKGKVIYGTTAPATADRLSQNLWIDTANNTNTPKRWNGSAWVAVTDKVATDALAAANSATTLANTKADSSAVATLTNRVTSAEGSITTQGQSITSLQGSLNTTNTNVVTAQSAAQDAMNQANAKGKVFFQNTAPATADRLSQNLWIDTTNNANTPKRWNGSAWVAVTDKVATDALAAANAASTLANTKADSTAVTALTNRVTSVEGTTTTQGQQITTLQGNVSTINTNLASKADGSAVTDLSNRVTATEGSITTQGQSITSLQGSLDTTNTNVTTAQTAAQNAMNQANAKGKVFYQATAPATAERLSQNLWIDTASNANTPKRWNGSAWVAVTDKVATDALAAANSATALANTKADASALTATNQTITAIDGRVTANANSITNLRTDLTNGLNSKLNATAISNYYTKSETTTEANRVAETVASGKVDEFKASLRIGGGNLQAGTKLFSSVTRYGNATLAQVSDASAQTDVIRSTQTGTGAAGFAYSGADVATVVIKNGGTYTLSFKVRGTVTPNYVYLMRASVNAANRAFIADANNPTISETDFKVFTFSVTALRDANDAYVMISSMGAAGWFEVAEVMLQEGNTATAWSESPLDVAKSLAANATAIQNVDTRVTQVDGKTTTNANAITTLRSDMNTALNSKLNASAIGNYYTKAETTTEANRVADTVAAGRVDEFKTNLTFGAANLVADPYALVYVSNHTGLYPIESRIVDGIRGVRRTGTSNANRFSNYTPTHVTIDRAGKYTYSLLVRPAEDMSLYLEGGSGVLCPANVWTKLKVTITHTVGSHRFRGLIGTNIASNPWVDFKHPQCEFGEYATEFKESDAYLKSVSDANASAIQTTNAEVTRVEGKVNSNTSAITALNTTVTGLNNSKADASALSSLTTRVTTAEGRITTNSNSITTLRNDMNTGLGTKLNSSVISNYYTKGETETKAGEIANTVAAGKVDEFKAALEANTLGELLNNPSFDTDAGWVTSAGTSNHVHDNTTGRLTVGSIKGVYSSNGLRLANNTLISFKGGKEYIISFWYKTSNDFVMNTSNFGISTNTASAVWRGTSLSGWATRSTDWKQVTHTFTSATDVTGVWRIGCDAFTAGTIWIDDASIVALDSIRGAIQSNSSALQTTNSEVTRVEGKVNANTSAITALNTTVTGLNNNKADASALNALTTRVTNAEGVNTTQGTALTNLQNSITSLQGTVNTKADASALNTLTSRVTGAESAINSTSTNVTNLTNKLSTVSAHTYALTSTLDLSGTDFDPNLYYLVTFALPVRPRSLIRIRRALAEAGKPVWATHTSGYACSFAWEVNGSGWGAGQVNRVINEAWYQYSAQAPLIFLSQMTNSSNEFVYLRGGAIYTYDVSDAVGAVTIRKDGYTASSQTQSGTRTYNASDEIKSVFSDIASASALSSLTSEVNSVKGTVTSQGTALTNLQNSVSSINGTLSTKADQSAVNTLTGRVTQTEQGIVAANSATTLLKSQIAANGDKISFNGTTNSIATAANQLGSSKVELIDEAGTATGKAVRFTGPCTAVLTETGITIDSQRVYQIKGRYKRIVGSSGIYIAVVNRNAEDTHNVNMSNALYPRNTVSSAMYAVSNAKPALNVWTEFSFLMYGKSTGASTGSGTAASPRTFPALAATMEIGVLTSYQGASTDQQVIDYIIIEDVTDSIANNNTGTALFNLQTTVTNQGNTQTSQGTAITNLQNSVSSINGTLSNKADVSALNALTTRVTNVEGVNTAQGDSLISLTSSINTVNDVITIKDTRSTNQPPSWYWANYPKRTVNEFKTQTTIGVNSFFGGTYCNLETSIPYGDLSGGHIVQTATSSNDPTAYVQRVSINTSAWGAWTQPIKDLRDTLGNKADASALNSLTTRVTNAEGVNSSQATAITNLSTTVGNQTTSINNQQSSIDGIRAVKTVTIDNNGILSGYGLVSELVNGQVTSSFGINANNFFIGSPANGNKPFIVTTTNTTIGGRVYPPGTWIDAAYITNLNANQITAGVINADRVAIGAGTTYASGYNPATNLTEARTYSDTKSRTFTSTPTVPYRAGDVWRDGNAIKISTVNRLTGSYTAADWALSGDVTANNTSANTAMVGSTAAATVEANAASGKNIADAIVSDLKITPAEKTYLYNEWNRIKNEYSNFTSQASTLGVSATTYTSAYNSLNTTAVSVPTIIANMNDIYTLTTAQRDSLRTRFNTFYSASASLSRLLDLAVNTTANNANTAANSANNTLSNWTVTGTTLIDGGKIKADTITVGEGNIVALSVDTLHIKDNAVTVPIGASYPDIVYGNMDIWNMMAMYLNTFHGGSLPVDRESHIRSWEFAFGGIASIIVNRSGGQALLTASLTLTNGSTNAISTSSIKVGGGTLSAIERMNAKLCLSIYSIVGETQTLIGRSLLNPSSTPGNAGVDFNGTISVSGAVDSSNHVGNVTYVANLGIGYFGNVSNVILACNQIPVRISGISISCIELKK